MSSNLVDKPLSPNTFDRSLREIIFAIKQWRNNMPKYIFCFVFIIFFLAAPSFAYLITESTDTVSPAPETSTSTEPTIVETGTVGVTLETISNIESFSTSPSITTNTPTTTNTSTTTSTPTTTSTSTTSLPTTFSTSTISPISYDSTSTSVGSLVPTGSSSTTTSTGTTSSFVDTSTMQLANSFVLLDSMTYSSETPEPNTIALILLCVGYLFLRKNKKNIDC